LTSKRQAGTAFFMKNLAMLGGTLLIAYWGAGPVSLDERAERPVREATHASAVVSEAPAR
jgi:uncharacterized membrane protein YphA (DoxX/SURF4 family)